MIKLKLEDIQVESYVTSAAPTHRGTVQANQQIELYPTPATNCASCPATCVDVSCRFTLCGEPECANASDGCTAGPTEVGCC